MSAIRQEVAIKDLMARVEKLEAAINALKKEPKKKNG